MGRAGGVETPLYVTYPSASSEDQLRAARVVLSLPRWLQAPAFFRPPSARRRGRAGGQTASPSPRGFDRRARSAPRRGWTPRLHEECCGMWRCGNVQRLTPSNPAPTAGVGQPLRAPGGESECCGHGPPRRTHCYSRLFVAVCGLLTAVADLHVRPQSGIVLQPP